MSAIPVDAAALGETDDVSQHGYNYDIITCIK